MQASPSSGISMVVIFPVWVIFADLQLGVILEQSVFLEIASFLKLTPRKSVACSSKKAFAWETVKSEEL